MTFCRRRPARHHRPDVNPAGLELERRFEKLINVRNSRLVARKNKY
jgi:hypothetical protein